MRKQLFGALVALGLVSPFACSPDSSTVSSLSGQGDNGTSGDCTLTQGYWKNHPKAWPVDQLKLGTVTYTKVELIAILKTPVKGNGLIKLAHQLIAAKLNVAAGVPDADIKVAIEAADALIGSLVCPPKGEGELANQAASELDDKLEAFNSGKLGQDKCGHGNGDHDDGDDGDGDCDGDHDDNDDGDSDSDGDHCGGDHDEDTDSESDSDKGKHDDKDTDTDSDSDSDDGGDCDGGDHPKCGDGTKDAGEACDDSNTVNGDGCSSTCQIELPVCGNGHVELGETCDDGNTHNGDGCSSVCICEPGCP
jgi:cysteine-rich repeat protein